MRNIIFRASFFVLFIGSIISCNSTQKLTKQEKEALIRNKIESFDYTFDANTAIPSAGRSINLSSGAYSLRVAKDSIIAYLPYYGRAYVAPIDPSEGGIKFVSTDFEYRSHENKKGVWSINIDTKDTKAKVRINMTICDNGNSTMVVIDNNRQPISFYGKIEE